MAGYLRRLLTLCVVSLGLLAVAATNTIAGGAGELAIDGYDPVAYFTEGKPARGSPDIEHEWDDHRYRFVRAEHRELFKADPSRYAPQFANYCAMALTRGVVVQANPKHWLISNGKLYIFAAPVGTNVFRNDLTGNIDKAIQHRALIEKR